MQSLVGNKEQAPASLREAVALCAKLAADSPNQLLWRQELATAYDRLGDALQQNGDIEGAINSYHQSLATAQSLPADTQRERGSQLAAAATHEALAQLLEMRKETAEASATMAEAIELRKSLSAKGPQDSAKDRMLMIDENTAGNIFNQLDKPADAMGAFRAGLEIARKQAAQPSADLQARHDLALSLFLVGAQLFKTSDSAAATDILREALPLVGSLVAEHPDNMTYRRLLSIVARNLGAARTAVKDTSGALEAFVAARDADKTTLTLTGASRADAELLKNDVAQIGLTANAMLLARQFDASLAALGQAEPAAPDQNWLDLVRAGDLMFLDRAEEAKAVLLKHRGEPTYSGKLWEGETLDMIARLRSAGFTHPQMDEIEAEFAKPK